MTYKKFGKGYIARRPYHNIDPYVKSSMKACQNAFKEEIKATIYHKFREATDVQHSIYTNYAITTNKAYYKVKDSMFYKNLPYTLLGKYEEYKPSGTSDLKDVISALDIIRRYSNLKLYCINDTQDTTDLSRKQYRKVMEKLFPDKSAFEK